ncbi:hypothetical protein ZPAH1_orf00095 [Aeromonas phage ZPAH1]|nr:hypothetical protein ASwh1_47 [Aeromonas phage Aswh_1]QQG33857.1 hypothetical protein ZPAH1_orf00095 [Aeromonas phage ZPAH1]
MDIKNYDIENGLPIYEVLSQSCYKLGELPHKFTQPSPSWKSNIFQHQVLNMSQDERKTFFKKNKFFWLDLEG